jgi:endonuclease III
MPARVAAVAKKIAKPAATKTAARQASEVGKVGKRPKAKPRPKLSKDEIAEIFSTFHRITPEPKGELESVNVFTLLVAVVLSAQAADAGVNKATLALFKVADTPEKMYALGEVGVTGYIKTIGLFRNKAKNVIALSKKLIDEHGAQVPADRDALETLPGVGRKTANVVMNMAFGQPTMAVDTHVFRVSNRIGLTKSKNPLQTENQLLALIPPEHGIPAHHWLILHGRYLCKARRPECWRCPIAKVCRFPDKSPPPGR